MKGHRRFGRGRGFGRMREKFERARGRGLYRSRNGMILGVCRGLAEYFDLSVFWIRVVTVVVMVCTSFFPVVGLYLLAALIMKPAPSIPFEGEADHEFYDSYTSSKSRALARLRRKFESIDRRIRRMEDKVTSKEFDWDRRFEG